MDAPQPGFVRAATAEARRTWGVPGARLVSGALLLLITAMAVPLTHWPGTSDPVEGAPFWVLNALLCWGGAWLGADLLPRGGRAGRLGARVAGRLLPLYAAASAGALALSLGWHSTRQAGWATGAERFMMAEVPVAGGYPIPLSALAPLFAAAVPFFVLAALAGSSFRRTPRLAVTVTVMLVSVAALTVAAPRPDASVAQIISALALGDVVPLAAATGGPNFMIVGATGWLTELLLGLPKLTWSEIPYPVRLLLMHLVSLTTVLALDLCLFGLLGLAARGRDGGAQSPGAER